MDLKYGDSKTYKYKLDKEQLKDLTSKTLRGESQTQFLYQLVDGDLNKLKELETKIKNCFYSACPDTKEEVEMLMSMESKSNSFSFN